MHGNLSQSEERSLLAVAAYRAVALVQAASTSYKKERQAKISRSRCRIPSKPEPIMELLAHAGKGVWLGS
jgi:hypothetical protein